MNKQPYVITETIYEYLQKFALSLVPKRRKIILVFELYRTNEIHPNIVPIGNDIATPPYCILLAIRTIADYLYQPIGAIFLFEGTSPEKLAKCIKAYILDLKLCGLHVIATISSTNKILTLVVEKLVGKENLKKTTNLHKYNTDYVKDIVHIYDPPHLLKRMFDVFMNGIIEYTIKGKTQRIFYKDILSGPKNIAYDVLWEILQDASIERGKLKAALKLFSEAMYMEIKINGGKESQQCGAFFKLMDELFDSFNTNEIKSTKYRIVVQKNSTHFRLWQDSIYIFESMKSIYTGIESTKSKKKNKLNDRFDLNEMQCLTNEILIKRVVDNIMTLTNSKPDDTRVETKEFRPKLFDYWVVTLKGMVFVCEKLLKRYNSVETRHFNLDILHEITKRIRDPDGVKETNVDELKMINYGYFRHAFDPLACLTFY